jgi:signal transduction histidine kinase
LRNPLTSITGAAHHLNTKLGPKLGTREKGMLAIIEKSIRYPDKMVNDLLEYSRELRLELVEARRPVNHKRRLSSYDGSTRNTHGGFN